MFQISAALTALSSSLNNQILIPVLSNQKIHVINKLPINTKESVLSEIEFARPNFLFISSNLPGVVKLEEVISKVKQSSPKTKIVILVSDSDSSKVVSYASSNASAVIFAENIPDCLEFALKQLSKDQVFLCGMTLNIVKESLNLEKEQASGNPGLLNLLTDREAEVLHSLTQGVNYKQISKMLFISESTVKTHINNIFTKLNVNDRTQAVLYALRHGIERVISNPAIISNATSVTVEQ